MSGFAKLGLVRGTDIYLIRDSEELSADGDRINCKLCGETRYIKAHSRMESMDYWKVTDEHDDDQIPRLTGCRCQKQARRRIARKRDGFFEKECEGDKKWIFHEGTDSERIYSDKRFYRLLNRDHESLWYDAPVFWTMHDAESISNYQTVRNDLDNTFIYDEFENSFFLYGSDLAVALMCSMRNAYLHFGYPCIYAKDIDMMEIIERQYDTLKDLENVEVLLIELTGELGNDDCDKLYQLLSYRNLKANAKTMFCSKASAETVCGEWITDKITEEIFKSIDGERNMLQIIG